MRKTTLLFILLFLSSFLVAQSNLIIDKTKIPVKIKDSQINLKKGKSIALSIPTRKVDTIVTFDPETYAEFYEIVVSGQPMEQTTVITKDSKTILSRTDFLANPMIYVSHNKVDYVPYRLLLVYFDKGKYRGLGFYDTATLQYFYKEDDASFPPLFNSLLKYFNLTTLQTFKLKLREKLSSDVSEIYIVDAEFVSSKTQEKLLLKGTFKLTLN
jgi:hypothetical protein